ncbi:glycosyl transferase family 1 [Galdieria sulphuraria]|uniref:Glycosyl transferase family 1 n=1 Tax=Galdieria sulphuraria TaxID=130081 RepID=M2WZ55_GALSU|nr:glycosyl transferase family 1 [Galdieria sulphuraria]EME29340.1 glycosyl transferase family 1 [Galdieria sulphuraria]|eukprot:XP_005705860.1 glycosyl transferase family 1 [Galdieria sulphuraria]
MKARPRRRRHFSLLTWLFVFRKSFAFWLFLAFLYVMNSSFSTELLSYSRKGANLEDPLLQNLSVLWLGPFKAGSGYGQESLNLLLSIADKLPLLKAAYFGDKVYSRTLDAFSKRVLDFFESLEPTCEELPSYYCDKSDIIDINCPCNRTAKGKLFDIVVIHSVPEGWVRKMLDVGAYKVGRTVFESDSVPKSWIEPVNKFVDELWVPSQFNVQGFQSSGVKKPVIAIPQCVEFPNWNIASLRRSIKYRYGCHKNDFIFLSVFAWNERKGLKYLLEAYGSEFSSEDDVCLLLLTRSYSGASKLPELNQTVANMLRKYRRLDIPSFQLVSQISDEELPKVYAASNSFVLATRGEGWARPIMEAIFYELPVIATNWSGHTEYFGEDTGFPVRVERLEKYSGKEAEMKPYVGLHLAVPSISDLRLKMRQVMLDTDTVRSRVQKAKRMIMTRYNPETIGDQILSHFIRIKKSLLSGSVQKDH